MAANTTVIGRDLIQLFGLLSVQKLVKRKFQKAIMVLLSQENVVARVQLRPRTINMQRNEVVQIVKIHRDDNKHDESKELWYEILCLQPHRDLSLVSTFTFKITWLWSSGKGTSLSSWGPWFEPLNQQRFSSKTSKSSVKTKSKQWDHIRA